MGPNTGTVIQVNVSPGGIPKLAVPRAAVAAVGLEGDGHAHPEHHGGPRKAVLWMTSEGIAELAALGFAAGSGTLGENITSQGIDRRGWRVGQRWRIGPDVILELTKLREPCRTLLRLGPGIQTALYDAAVNAGNPESPRWGLSGFYCAVIQPGIVQPGDKIQLL